MNNATQQTQCLSAPKHDIEMKCNDFCISENTTSSSYAISPQSSESSQCSQNTPHSAIESDGIKTEQPESNDSDQPSYDLKDTITKHGYIPLLEMCKTLQGSIWKVWYTKRECEAIVKITNKTLSAKRIGINHKSGEYFMCKENIEQELNMLHALNQNASKTPPAMIRFYDVFQDTFNIFVVMEHGGSKLLHFVNRAHHSIINGKMLLSDWQNSAKLITKQIVQFVDWLHNVHHVCHLDISLENLLITNVEWKYDKKRNTFSLAPNFQIKFIDFGLAEKFTQSAKKNDDNMHDAESSDGSVTSKELISDAEDESEDACKISFDCNKFAGKLKYECPNIYNKETFDARKADIWSVGVCWFMICVGFDPWKVPKGTEDDCYHIMVNQHRLSDVLAHWKRSKYLNAEGKDFFYVMFSDFMYRASARKILAHSWFK